MSTLIRLPGFSILMTMLQMMFHGWPCVTGGFPSQRPATQSFDVFFDLHLNKWLGEQSRRRRLGTPSRSLKRHCYDNWYESNRAHIMGYTVIGDFVRLLKPYIPVRVWMEYPWKLWVKTANTRKGRIKKGENNVYGWNWYEINWKYHTTGMQKISSTFCNIQNT